MVSVKRIIHIAQRTLCPKIDNVRCHIQNPDIYVPHLLRHIRLASVGKSPLDVTASPEKTKMINKEPYDAQDPDLLRACDWAESLCTMYNRSSVVDKDFRFKILQKLFGTVGKGTVVEPPFQSPYGRNIFVGKNVYMNYGCVILDRNYVVIGDEVKFGPHVLVSTVNHPLDPVLRNEDGIEFALPIKIEDGVWIGMGAKLLPGVTIGKGSTVAAGAVVTKNVSEGMVVMGVPAEVKGTVEELAEKQGMTSQGFRSSVTQPPTS